MDVQVMNYAGQTIFHRFLGANIREIDLSGHISGIYYIKITYDSATRTEKILLK